MRLTSAVGFVLALSLLPWRALASPHAAGREVTTIRDERGVPHVHSASLEALFYGVGYASGQDRLWQAETLRRAGSGTLAEWFGPGSVASDVQARLLLGPASRRAALFAAATPRVKAIYEAFAAGMNAWIDEATASGKLPLEYATFGVTPRPWSVDDSLAVHFLLASQFGWFGSSELDNALAYADLVARLGPAEGARAFADTHWLDDPSASVTDPAIGAAAAPRGHAPAPVPTLPAGVAEAAREYRAGREAADQARKDVGLRRGPMSNAIVVGPRMSADGWPLLLGGPQMGYGAPQINHEMGIHGAGLEITGMMIAGWPLIPIGVGRGYAWSLTSGGSDNSDIFALQLNPLNPGQYRYQGAWRDLACRVETIPVAGAAPVAQTLCSSVHGPVIAAAGGAAYAFANTTFGAELSSYEGWLSLGGARSLAEFRQGAAAVAYNFNVFYADVENNIAHFHVGRIPVRAPGANPWFPQPGDGSSEWQGTIPFEQMPHAVNPTQGWLANWNNKPGPGWSNSSGGFWAWGPVHRVNTLRNIMEATPPRSMTLDGLAAINRQAGLTTDSPSGNADTVVVTTLLGDLLGAVDASADPRLPAALALLEGWDLLQTDQDADGLYDSPAVALFNTWWQALVGAVITPKLGAGADPTVSANVLHRLLMGGGAALPILADYLGGSTIGAAVTESLVGALDALEARHGTPDMGAWLQQRAEIFWAPGGIGSVPNTLWMNRGTYNQLVHLGRGNHLRAMNVIAPGQSGDFRSPHFADQLPLYQGWTYKPMRLTLDDQLLNAESVTRLRVP